MLKLGRVTKEKVFFLVLVYVFNIDLFEFSAAILEKGLLTLRMNKTSKTWVSVCSYLMLVRQNSDPIPPVLPDFIP